MANSPNEIHINFMVWIKQYPTIITELHELWANLRSTKQTRLFEIAIKFYSNMIAFSLSGAPQLGLMPSSQPFQMIIGARFLFIYSLWIL